MLHTIPITLDISKVGDQKTVTGIRQNDTNTVKFSISLVNGSDTFDINNLTTPTVIMFGIKPDGKVIVNYADIVNGHIEYTLKAQDTTAAGTVKWQVGIFEGLNTKYATPRFSSVVEPAVVGDEEIESTNSLDVLLEAIDEVNSLMSNNNITCRYSFMLDSYGRIFSYTNHTSITNNSFAQYDNYQDMISKNHMVWIASNVTNVANGSLGDKTKVIYIICEAKQEDINFNEYSDCNISYGTNALLQFYTLSSLSRLLAEKVDRPVGFDDLDAVLQNQIEISLKSFIFIVSSISMLEMIRYCDPYRIHTLTLTSSAATFFGVESGTRAELRISGSWETFLTREIRILETSDRWVQIVEGTESEHSFGTWVKVDPISDGALSLDKLEAEFVKALLSSGWSFLADEDRRIFAISSDTQITSSSFSRETEKTNSSFYVWLSKNVTSISTQAFSSDEIENIICMYAESYETTIPAYVYNSVRKERGYNKALLKIFILNSIFGNYEDILDIDGRFPIAKSTLATDLKNEIERKVDYQITPNASSSVFNLNVSQYRLYYDTVSSGVEYLSFVIENIATANKTQFRLSKNGVEWRKKVNGTWGTWGIAIPDEAITSGKIGQGEVKATNIDGGAITSGKIGQGEVKATNIDDGAVEFSKLGSNLVAKSNNGQAWAFADDVTIPTTLVTKNWILNNTEDKIVNPTKIIYFDTNGCISAITNSLPSQQGYTVAHSTFVPSAITTIPDSVLTLLPNVDVYYVDNSSSAVHLETDVQTAVQNEQITIYYKGEFNLAELFATSQKNLNDRLTALESQIGGLINGDEVSY